MTTLSTALEAPRWALDFVRRHPALVLGLSLVPAVERFTGQIWERGAALGLACEMATTAARLALIAAVVQVAIIREPRIGGAPTRVRHAVHHHAGSIAVQVGLLVGLAVLADVGPERLLPALLPVGPLYWGVLLAVKNLTVIPFTMIWLIAAVRQVLLPRQPVSRP